MLSQAMEMNMAKLSDTQLMVLSNAARRDDGAAIVPDRMNRAAAAKVGASLVARKLMREIRSKPGMPVWRTDENDRPMSLILLRAGRDAIGVENNSEVEEPAVVPNAGKTTAIEPAREPSAGQPRVGTKQALVIGMLLKGGGVTLDALVEATGWLPHTTRAAMTGLRKRGYAIERSRDGAQGSIYHIVGQPQASKGA
jgi:hypothetical protein